MKRLPVIRHIRYYWNAVRLALFVSAMAQLGLGLGHPNPADVEHLRRIWEGKA